MPKKDEKKPKKAKWENVLSPEEQYLLDRYAKLREQRKLRAKDHGKEKDEPKEKQKVPLKTLLEQTQTQQAPSAKMKRRISKLGHEESKAETPPEPEEAVMTPSPPIVSNNPVAKAVAREHPRVLFGGRRVPLKASIPPDSRVHTDNLGASDVSPVNRWNDRVTSVLQGDPRRTGGGGSVARPTRNQCLFISKIHHGASLLDFASVLTGFGKIETMRILPELRIGVVKYESFEEADLARDELHKAFICGAVVKVDWADTRRFEEIMTAESGGRESIWSAQSSHHRASLLSYEDV